MPPTTPAPKADTALATSVAGSVAISRGPAALPVWNPTATASQATGPRLPVECWGDSLTWGDGSSNRPATGWPARLATLTGRSFVNHGHSGAVSQTILTEFEAAPGLWAHPTVIWVGRNDIGNLVANAIILANIAEFVTRLNGMGRANYLILGVTNGGDEPSGSTNYSTIAALNASIAAAYPGHYLDIRAFWVSQYNPAIAQDVIDHGNDVPPTSLRFDNLHPNDAGYALIAAYLQANCPFPLAADDPTDPVLTVSNAAAIQASPVGISPGAPVNSICPSGAIPWIGPHDTLELVDGPTFDGDTFGVPAAQIGGSHTVFETRTVPSAVGGTAELGAFNLTGSAGAGAIEIVLEVDGSNVSQVRRYLVPATYAATGGTYYALTPRDSGSLNASDDVVVDYLSAGLSSQFRIRRTVGSTATTAHVTLRCCAAGSSPWISLTQTGTATAPTATYGSNQTTRFPGSVQVAGALVITGEATIARSVTAPVAGSALDVLFIGLNASSGVAVIDVALCTTNPTAQQSRDYTIGAFYNCTAGVWMKVAPSANARATAGATDVIDLDVFSNGTGVTLRIRKTAGTTVPITAYLMVRVRMFEAVVLTPLSTASYTATAPATTY